MMRGAVSAAALVAWVALGSTVQAATLIHAGRVIDGVSARASVKQTIVVEQGRIVAVEAGYREAQVGDQLIDLRDATVMPGLMDMHVHITSEYSRSSELDRFKKKCSGCRTRRGNVR